MLVSVCKCKVMHVKYINPQTDCEVLRKILSNVTEEKERTSYELL